jgi:hypothetical protein
MPSFLSLVRRPSCPPWRCPLDRCGRTITFPILSDAKGKVGAAFCLRFELPDYLIELHKSLKNDLPTFNENPS